MITIRVNGESRHCELPLAVADALLLWGYKKESIAVAINGEFVARSSYATMQIKDGDAIDVLSPVQGG